MPEYVAPGVYVEEGNPGRRSIVAVSTATAGMIGHTERGPDGPTLVTSWADYERTFGGYLDRAPFDDAHASLPYAVRGFFENGGQRLFVARLVPGAGSGADGGSDTDVRRALAALTAVEEVALLAAPDAVAIAGLRDAIIETCERAKDRFAILSADEVAHVTALRPPRDTSYAAFYHPRVRVPAPHTAPGYRVVAPVGHLAGIYARVDAGKGVHKAPANEVVRGLADGDSGGTSSPLEIDVTRNDQDILNPLGVNVIRDFRAEGRDVRAWGARTMSSDPEWRYISVRRTCIFVERSIIRSTRWVAFEPNDASTWSAVHLSATNFLRGLWRDGALVGATDDQAFFVRCDRSTMTQQDLDEGRVVCMIGVALVKPAEFVVLRISWRSAGPPP